MAAPVTIRVLFFGPLREKTQRDGVTRTMEAGTTVNMLLETLQTEDVLSARLCAVCAVAVNQEYQDRACVLADGDEVAILPPVSGGVR